MHTYAHTHIFAHARTHTHAYTYNMHKYVNINYIHTCIHTAIHVYRPHVWMCRQVSLPGLAQSLDLELHDSCHDPKAYSPRPTRPRLKHSIRNPYNLNNRG